MIRARAWREPAGREDRRWRGGAALLAVGLALSVASPAGAYQLRGSVVASGATPSGGVAGGPFAMLGTAGMPVVGRSGNGVWSLAHGFWSFGGARVVDVGPNGGGPVALALGPAVPNPSRGGVRLALALPHAAQVRLLVLDVSGRVVDEAGGPLPAGRHTLDWTGTSRDGRAVRPGVYFARVLVDGRMLGTRRLVELGGH